MQELAQCEDVVVKITQNKVFLAKNSSSPPPRIGNSHGGLMDFSSELTRNTPSPEMEPLMEDLGTQNKQFS